MNFMYIISIVKNLFHGQLSKKDRQEYYIKGEKSLLRRKQYLEERNEELKKLIQTTDNLMFES